MTTRDGRWWTLAVRLLAPPEEWEEIAGDLADEAARLTATQGARAARTFVWWQVRHSALGWMARRWRRGWRARGQGGRQMMRGLGDDLRRAVRRLWKAPAFSALAIGMLAVAIGAVSTIFSLAYAVWLKPLPWQDPDRVVWVNARHEASRSSASLSPEEFLQLRGAGGALSDVAGFTYGAGVARVHDEPTRLVIYQVSPNLFRLLGVRAAVGRDFLEEDGAQRTAVILSERAWAKYFNRAPDITSRTLDVAGGGYRIVGVMPRGFAFPVGLEGDAWRASDFSSLVRNEPGFRAVQVVARLADGHTATDAAAELVTRGAQFAAAFPDTNTGWSLTLSAAGETTTPAGRRAFSAPLGVVGLFLLMASTNLAGLLLARNLSRQGEYAICLALGASRWRLARALFVEAGVLAGCGAAFGIVAALNGARALAAWAPRLLGAPADIAVSPAVLAITIAASIVAAVLVAMWPAVGLRALPPAGAAAHGRSVLRGSSSLQRGLVVVEVVLAVVLLSGAVAMLRAFDRALTIDRGFDPRGLQAIDVTLPFDGGAFASPTVRAQAFNDILARLAAMPGVTAVGAATGTPGSLLGILGAAPITPAENHAPVMAGIHAVTPGYFTAMGVDVRLGRGFAPTDVLGAPGVAMVNDVLAAQYPGGNPVGQRIQLSLLGGPPSSLEIVGVAGSLSLNGTATPRVFVSLAQASPFWVDVVYRTTNAGPSVDQVRRVLRAFNADLLLENESSFHATILNALALYRIQSGFAGIVGALAVIVAGIGLFAFMSFLVAQHRRETAICLALGADPARLCRRELARALTIAGVGVIVGVGVSGLAIRGLASQVFGLNGVGAGVYLRAAGLVLAVSLAAAWRPARRAMRTDPLRALRLD